MCIIGLVYIGSPAWKALAATTKWSYAALVPLIVLSCVLMWDKLSNLRSTMHQELEIPNYGLQSFDAVGEFTQIERVVGYASHAIMTERYFRTWLRADQEGALRFTWATLLFLQLMMQASAATLSLVAIIAYGTVALQILISRVRYRLRSGELVIEGLSWWSVVETRTIALRDARIVCDFARGVLVVSDAPGEVSLNLRSVFNPHHFVGNLLAAANEQESVLIHPGAQPAIR